MGKELRCAAIVVLAVLATGSSAWSQVMTRPTAQLKGAATLFQLRIPFGGREQEAVRPTITFDAGPVFQEQNDSYLRGSYYTTPSIQAGVSLDGDPVLKVGTTDLAKKKEDRTHAQEETLIGFMRR